MQPRTVSRPEVFATQPIATEDPAATTAPESTQSKFSSWGAKAKRIPIRFLRAGLGISSRNTTPSENLADTAPNTLTSSRFEHSQHPSSGPVQPVNVAKRGLAPLTEEKRLKFPECPLVNKDNEVESSQAHVFSLGLMKELNHAEELILHPPEGERPLSKPLQLSLLNDIRQIRMKLVACSSLETSDSMNMHQFLRGNFAEVAKIAEKIVKRFPGSSRPTAASRQAGKPEGLEKQLSHFFDDFSKLSTEVKRHHYDRGVQLQINSYADEIFQHFLKEVPSVALQRKGSELIISKELSAKITAGVEVGNGKIMAGGSLGYAYTLMKRMFVDLDSDACGQELKSHTVSGSGGIKIGALFRKDGGKGNLAAAMVNGKLTYSSGNYYDYKTWHEYIKAEIQRDGDKWKVLSRRHSGDENSKYNRIRQKRNATVSYVFGDLLGVKNLRSTVAPIFNTDKCLKGRNNTDQIASLASRLIQRLPPGEPITVEGRNVATLTELAYPPISKALGEFEPKFGEVGVNVAGKQYSGSADLVSQRSPSTLVGPGDGPALRRVEGSLGVEAGFDSFDWGDSENGAIRFNAKANLEVNYASQQIEFLRTKPVHEQLNPSYNKDIDLSKFLLNSLLTPPNVHPHDRAPQTEYLNKLCAELQAHEFKPTSGFRSSELKNQIIDDMLKQQYAQLTKLRKNYLALSDLSGQARSFKDRKYKRDNDAKVFEEKRAKFIFDTFGLTDKSHGRTSNLKTKKQKEFYKNLTNDPEFFMIKSYDALSTALGCIGVGICDGKKNVADEIKLSARTRQEFDLSDSNKGNQTLIDVMYKSLGNAMDGVYMPIDKEKLLRGASIQAHSESTSTTYGVGSQAQAGYDMAPIKAISGNGTDPTGGFRRSPGDENYVEPNPVGVWNLSSTAGVGVRASYKHMNSEVHPNPVRQGIYDFYRISGSADGVTPAAIKGLVSSAVNIATRFGAFKKDSKIRRMLGLSPTDSANSESLQINTDPSKKKEDDGFIEQAVLTAKQTAVAQHTGEIELIVGRKTSPPLKDDKHPHKTLTYRTETQFVRTMARDTQNVGLSAGVPLHEFGVPVTVGGGFTRTCVDGNVLGEVMGKNPAYQILSFIEIQEVLNKAAIKKSAAPGKTLINSADVDKECDWKVMRALFEGESVDGEPPIDADFKVGKFFTNPETITGFLTDFNEYRKDCRDFPKENEGIHDTKKATRKDGEDDVPRFEFDQFDDNPEYWETIVKMSRNEEHAPGTTSFSKPNGDLNATNKNGDPRPKLTPEEEIALERVVNHFKNNKMTAKERMEYFMDGDIKDGQVVFSAYCKVLTGYDKINEALKSRNTYRSRVVNNSL
ncbi:MAG: hypothetical protein V4695_02445 [Pseudomonadota bacterium]